MPDTDLPPNAPLRHRLWFRFWRGWRKGMIGLVVLVAVAWGTNPSWEQHQRAIYGRSPPFDSDQLSPHILELNRHYAGVCYHDRRLFSFWSEPFKAGQGSYFFTPRVNSFGLFGFVWVLD